MAISFPKFCLPTYPNSHSSTPSKPKTFLSKTPLKFPIITVRPRKFPKASEKEKNPDPPAENEEMRELGMEIKKAMMEREDKEKESGFVGGVVEEIKEIEWPPFNKVLGITGVVLGVIAGSSVVLLSVNAVLAEISDRVFVGRGVQDFFG